MKNIISLFCFSLIFSACSQPSPVVKPAAENNSTELPSASEIQAIKSEFPNAVPYNEGIDTVLEILNHFGISARSILWGQSICVDDITSTKNKLSPEIKGPFNIGGLAGLPFTGITGLDAFSHHVPEEGTAILFVAPHIGYSEAEGWGKILRHEQRHASTCCGALVAALNKLQRGELNKATPGEDDYQEGVIEQIALAHRNEILSSPNPLITFTQLIYKEAIRRMSEYASKLKEMHFRYVVVIGAIIVNTDHTFTDYLSIENVAIRDVQKNEWVLGAESKSAVVMDTTRKWHH